jgi:hypothetical protein
MMLILGTKELDEGGEEEKAAAREKGEEGQPVRSPVDDDALHAGDEPRVETPHDPVSLKICLI